ncbi:MAG: hypothetical protein ACXVB9_15895 [Bdellovibrionota bacterium]
MFQSFMKLALFSLARKWFTPRSSSGAPNAIHPNVARIKALAIHYVSLITLLFLNFLLFVSALVVTAVATAHSFDVFGHFQATAVFFTGLIMGGTALAIGAAAGYALGKTKVEMNDVLLVEPEVEPLTVTDRMLRPFFEGVMEGLRRPRRAAAYDESGRPAA